MSVTIQDLKSRLQSKIHSGTINKVQDIDNLIFEAACNVLAKIDPTETERVIALTLVTTSNYYTTPADIKNDKIIAIRDRSTVTAVNGLGTYGVYTSIFNEVPTGTINGTNLIFTLAHTPISGSLNVYVDGVRLNSGTDYTFVGTTLTLIIAPATELIVDYQYE